MTKEITMVVTCKTAQRRYRYHGNRPLVRVPERVDCEKLSAPARLIAESILTTARDDDMSLIWVTGPSIYERLQSEGKTELSVISEISQTARIPLFGDLMHCGLTNLQNSTSNDR